MTNTLGSLAYAAIANRLIEEGWAPDLLTFMFDPLPGSPSAIRDQMAQTVQEVYARFITRVVRYPTSPSQVGRLPVWFCAPDYPVFKREKQSLRVLVPNEGAHFHAFSLLPPWSRKVTTMADHLLNAGTCYVRPGNHLSCIDVEPIIDNIERVTEYVTKAINRGRVGEDEMLILPRSWRELRQSECRIGHVSSIYSTYSRPDSGNGSG